MCRLGESSNRIVSGRTQPARISFVRKERADKRRCRPLLAFAPTINFGNGRERHFLATVRTRRVGASTRRVGRDTVKSLARTWLR